MIGIFFWSVLYISCFVAAIAIGVWIEERCSHTVGRRHTVWCLTFAAYVIVASSLIIAVGWDVSEDSKPDPYRRWQDSSYTESICDIYETMGDERLAQTVYAVLDIECKEGVQ